MLTAVADLRLSARSNQLLAPLLSLVDDEETAARITALLLEQEEELAADRSMQVEALVLEAILRLREKHNGKHGEKHKIVAHLPLSLIREEVQKSSSGEFDRPLTSRYLGSIIRSKLRMKSFKSGVYMVTLPEKEDLWRLCDKYKAHVRRYE